MPSSAANCFFATSTARSALGADRIMIERWQQWKSFSFLGISFRKFTRYFGISHAPNPVGQMPSWLDGRLALMIWINFAARAVSASPGDLARIEVGEAAWPHAFLAAVAGSAATHRLP
jgi:hypothetical protein